MKTCTKCGVEKPLDDYLLYAGGRKRKARCKTCRNADLRAWKEAKRPKIVCQRCGATFTKRCAGVLFCETCRPIHRKEYASANTKKWRERNPDHYRRLARELATKRRAELSPFYVKSLLSARGFEENEITPELIGANRNVIKIKRAIKEMQK